jgi:hypothetical protein
VVVVDVLVAVRDVSGKHLENQIWTYSGINQDEILQRAKDDAANESRGVGGFTYSCVLFGPSGSMDATGARKA